MSVIRKQIAGNYPWGLELVTFCAEPDDLDTYEQPFELQYTSELSNFRLKLTTEELVQLQAAIVDGIAANTSALLELHHHQEAQAPLPLVVVDPPIEPFVEGEHKLPCHKCGVDYPVEANRCPNCGKHEEEE